MDSPKILGQRQISSHIIDGMLKLRELIDACTVPRLHRPGKKVFTGTICREYPDNGPPRYLQDSGEGILSITD
jgi:hypothetical protein